MRHVSSIDLRLPAGARAIAFRNERLLSHWHSLELADVIKSVQLQLEYVAETVHRQNLSWTFQYVMDCLDSDLKQYVLSKISHLDPDVGQTGPVVFMVVAQRILHTTENLAQKVINGLIQLRLTQFPGENVVECIFTVRNVLKFLRFGEVNSFAPRTTLTLVYDVFRGTSVGPFRAYIQQLQDFQMGTTNVQAEDLFSTIQLKYEELLMADRWAPQKKRPSTFHLGDPKTYVQDDNRKGGGDKGKDNDDDKKKNGDGKKKRPTHDKSGKKIDYTPPKKGESKERTDSEGKKESWCGECKRWGSHLSAEHDEWLAKFRADRKKFNKEKKDGQSNGGATRASGSVTFASALRSGRFSLQADRELVDGIDV